MSDCQSSLCKMNGCMFPQACPNDRRAPMPDDEFPFIQPKRRFTINARVTVRPGQPMPYPLEPDAPGAAMSDDDDFTGEVQRVTFRPDLTEEEWKRLVEHHYPRLLDLQGAPIDVHVCSGCGAYWDNEKGGCPTSRLILTAKLAENARQKAEAREKAMEKALASVSVAVITGRNTDRRTLFARIEFDEEALVAAGPALVEHRLRDVYDQIRRAIPATFPTKGPAKPLTTEGVK